MKKIISLMLFVILSFTSIPFASALSIANCNLNCFSAGTPVQTNSGFKPIEGIRVGDFVLTKDERTGKTGYNQVVELFQRQANETYQITVKGITITTTEEHPFWIPGRGWVEARHLKVGDLLQNPEGKLYPIDRIEIKNDSTTVYNFRVEGVHNYFVTELEIWTHNCGAGGVRNIPMRAPSGGGGGSSYKGTSQIKINRANGDAFEKEVVNKISSNPNNTNVRQQITVKTESGVKTRIDIVSTNKQTGQINCVECKASPTVVGKGKAPYTRGTKIPPTKVHIERKMVEMEL
ncbi:HINT domain-containing protein [Paenibacillus melissococcoides]|uniref:HINT domain-containing protein n=1 Tax=Paenibacillus melissococcoides TaxID=2912268 RepID=A0ABM9G151_9BACL|nr:MULTISPECIES: polymorphic toxin-type HINT domain-containing protein [Paenibacillus]MEB9895497.1 polymorphic toxin-type HINT domain-containing protein [Bacillus cereus]CAH8244936.1 HINT domain-containing protein [Paenibacillus melissococcoides]CAH8709416.1 HINT domain-containing protein [Paenibacillus melissococcoides]CAH8710144.1 HINT domain-containing protein [Paenibacillus melissococcoides]GIO82728.1 hypothetical protein J6TS7_63380 [Paenibacillus dendritiformis]